MKCILGNMNNKGHGHERGELGEVKYKVGGKNSPTSKLFFTKRYEPMREQNFE